MFALLCWGQNSIPEATIKQVETWLTDIPDELYIDGKRYFISQSFLDVLPGKYRHDYKQIYPNVPFARENIKNKPQMRDVNYYTTWVIKDSILYLRDIFFPYNGLIPGLHKRYDVMEEFTGRHFTADDDEVKNQIPENSEKGSMQADWVTGDFIVKIPPRKLAKHSIYNNLPYTKLTFNNGRLIKSEELNSRSRYYNATVNEWSRKRKIENYTSYSDLKGYLYSYDEDGNKGEDLFVMNVNPLLFVASKDSIKNLYSMLPPIYSMFSKNRDTLDNYKVIWLVKDNKLFMRDIVVVDWNKELKESIAKKIPKNKRYKLMEQLTGDNFKRDTKK